MSNLKHFVVVCFLLFALKMQAQSLDRLWTAAFNGQGDFSDRYTAAVTDEAGNLIVAGSTAMPDQNRNLLVRKLAADGTVLWTQIYNGPGDGADEALALVTDAGNNIYVTGFQKGSGAGNDFITLKYAPDSTLLWTAIYNYSSNQYDQSNSIALGSNFVVVTGQSDNDPTSGTNDDYVTIKYNMSDGTPVWTQRYNGLGNAQDRPAKVVADASGNVFVAGTSDNGANFDFVTLKYSAVGELLWVQYGDRGDTDRATDMIADATGNIYITGRSMNTANNYDYYTLKYNTNGSLLWSNIYDYVEDDRPNRLTLDPSGNVLVTGQSDQNFTAITNYDIATIKINNANGALTWDQRFAGTGNDTDEGIDLWCDTSGNVLVAGETDTDPDPLSDNHNWILLQYTASGSLNWQQNIDVAGNHHDVLYSMKAANGQLFVCGYTQAAENDRNAIVKKIDTNGTTLWTSQYNGTGDNGDNARAVTAFDNNNFYVAGYTVSYYEDRNLCVSKRSAATGALLWLYQLNGTSPGSADEAVAIAADNNGNVFATGYTKNSGTSSDITTLKLSPAGDSIWVQLYNGPASESDRAADLALDNSGNIYVAGRTDADASVLSDDNFITIKYDQNGNQLWLRTYAGAAGGEDRAAKIRVAANGSVYVAGREWNGTDFDITIVSYAADGTAGWTYTYPDAGGDELPSDFALDAAGNLYITGSLTGLYQSGLTFSLSPSGNLLWAQIWGETGFTHTAEALAIDPDNRIWVAASGPVNQNGTMVNGAFALLYNSSGALSDTLPGSVIDNMTPNGALSDDIITAPNGYACLAAHADETNVLLTDYNWHIALLNPFNQPAATDVWAGSANTTDVPNALLLLGNTLLAAGSSSEVNGQRNMQFIAYNTAITGIDPENTATTSLYIYPNPAQQYLVVEPNAPASGQPVTCRVYDLTGRLMPQCTITAGEQNRFMLNISALHAGMYWMECNGKITKFVKTGN
ncbi:T9SS C-terminal target domain-containing protein [Sphingobacteriales bacterium UPWRP_1]|nr:hypothetical protein BVG80_02690 [Sphingobacteriales bacterium TSM_CSM]PSJ75264.1 T9SS C-terminal target domain-containing protein [Sphingobacteriales bacterium UPWRP_1]